jgi:hypothetical protein
MSKYAHWDGAMGGFNCKAREAGKKGRDALRGFVSLWVFGSEVIIQMYLCKLSSEAQREETQTLKNPQGPQGFPGGFALNTF